MKSAEKEIRINCFGRLAIYIGDMDQSMKMNSEKARELIAFLMTYKGDTVAKDTVCEALWEETPLACSRDCLYKLVKKVNEMELPIRIECSRKRIRLNVDNIKSDLFEFEDLIRNENEMDVADMEKLVSIYKGSLFEEECYGWISTKAAIHDKKYLDVLLKLVEYYENSGLMAKARLHKKWIDKMYDDACSIF